jgi:hypothetical protein
MADISAAANSAATFYVTLYDYTAAGDAELSFETGDVLAVYDATGDWWYAQNGLEQAGWVPPSFLDTDSPVPFEEVYSQYLEDSVHSDTAKEDPANLILRAQSKEDPLPDESDEKPPSLAHAKNMGATGKIEVSPAAPEPDAGAGARAGDEPPKTAELPPLLPDVPDSASASAGISQKSQKQSAEYLSFYVTNDDIDVDKNRDVEPKETVSSKSGEAFPFKSDEATPSKSDDRCDTSTAENRDATVHAEAGAQVESRPEAGNAGAGTETEAVAVAVAVAPLDAQTIETVNAVSDVFIKNVANAVSEDTGGGSPAKEGSEVIRVIEERAAEIIIGMEAATMLEKDQDQEQDQGVEDQYDLNAFEKEEGVAPAGPPSTAIAEQAQRSVQEIIEKAISKKITKAKYSGFADSYIKDSFAGAVTRISEKIINQQYRTAHARHVTRSSMCVLSSLH